MDLGLDMTGVDLVSDCGPVSGIDALTFIF